MIDAIVFAEDAAGFQASTALTDRVLEKERASIDLETSRRWLIVDGSCWLKWTSLKDRWRRLSRGRQRQLHGRYGGPNKGEYLMARKALLLAADIAPKANAALLVRDSDGESRAADFRNACDGAKGTLVAVVCVPNPETEAWMVSGFDPRNQAEEKRHSDLTTRLPFDPVGQSERLVSTKSTLADGHPNPKDAKLVLHHLSEGDRDRERSCLTETPLELLAERGTRNGMADFLTDARKLIALV